MSLHKTWLALSPGDTVEMIAAGFPFNWDNVRASQKILESWNLKLHYPKNILGAHPVSANSREARLEFFKRSVQSESKIIWAARGGYGSLHLVNELKKIKPPRQAKLFIGFSDNCTLQHYVAQEWGWPVLHGPHVDRLSHQNSGRLAALKKIVFGQTRELSFHLRPMNARAEAKRVISSSVIGGNLMTTQSTLGTSWQLEGAGKILFFEETGERGYRVDRILEHMRLMGLFAKARAVIFGPFVGGEEPGGGNKTNKVLSEFAASSGMPVFAGIRSGHVPNSLALPMNTRAVLNTGRAAQIVVATGCAP